MFVGRGRERRGPLAWLIVAFLLLMGMTVISAQPSPSAAHSSDISSAIDSEQALEAIGHTPQTNRISAENALPGTDEWASIGNYDINRLQAFSGATSVNAGDSISVHVKSTGSSLSARLYRLGYYQNHGARLYATYSGIATPPQPNCTLDNTTGLVSCPWAATFTINTDPNWISGFYLVRLDSNNGYRFFVYFIVRNDGYNSDILVMEPSKTNQAYNEYGGESLYYKDPSHGGTRTRAYQVSFDRPYATGAGTGSLFTHDTEMVRWLEASGYDVSYISDIDRAANPGLLLNHRVFMVEGHDEYWTWGERDAVEAARDSGVNIIFASGNESYWRIRLGASQVGPNRVITCYKDANLDPSPDKTITFRDLGRPENSLVGTGYQSYLDEETYAYPWTAYAPGDRWYFDCTGLQPGDEINNVVADEWDALLNNGFTPPGTDLMAQGQMSDPHGNPLLHQATIYTATSGARVFAAGSIVFSWGLMDHSYPNEVFQPAYQSNAADPRLEQVMANILDRFAGYWDGQPRQCQGQSFYKIDPRPTRTPMPRVPTATGTPPTFTPTFTPAGSVTASSIPNVTSTPTTAGTSTPTPACSISYVSLDVPKGVPDQGVVTSTLTVNDAGTISDIAATGLSIQHTFASDLSVYLTSPQGTRIALFTNVCGSQSWTAANTGFSIGRQAPGRMGSTCPPGQATYLPKDGSLDPFVGQQAEGTWTLEVDDGGPGDVGTLLGWGLRISYGSTCQTGTPSPSITATRSPTLTTTRTVTPVPTNTASPTNSATPSGTNTAVFSRTATPTSAARLTSTSTASPSVTRTATRVATFTPTPSYTDTATDTRTPSATNSPTRTNTPPPSNTPTSTATSTAVPSRTATPARTPTRTPTFTPTPTNTRPATRTATISPTVALSRTPQGGTATPTLTGACSMTYISLDVPKDVPDQGVTTSTLTIADVGTIQDIRVVNLTIQHTYASDLSVHLTSPQGTRVALFTNICGSSVWTAANTGFTISRHGSSIMGTTCPPGQGTYLPEEGSLVPLLGQSSNGTWVLEVRDGGPYDVGTLHAWGLVIDYAGPVCPLGNEWQPTATAAVPSPSPTAAPLPVSFIDVPDSNSFAAYVQWMASRGFVSGYDCGGSGEPCPGRYFRPGASVSRGQLLKMVVNAAGWGQLNPKEATFVDVPRNSAFFTFIETAVDRGIVSGYPCGGSGEPCDPLNRPYFRPGTNITRGQLSKVIALAQGYGLPNPDLSSFADVTSSNTFFRYIEAVRAHGIINGYPCGSPAEPCDTQNRPYFRPLNSATRGQVAKMVTVSSGGP